MGMQGLAKACGNTAPGQVAPPAAKCDSGVCQQAVLAWWPKCKGFDVYSTLDSNNHQQITHFYDACKQRSQPTCGACSGHASAQDTLPADKNVLTAGSPQRAEFTSLFVGEMSNLLCVPSGQVHLNSITAVSSGTRRSLAETGAKVSLQVSWTVDAATPAQAQGLMAAGQKAIGMPGMGRRQLQTGGAQCVLGQNKGALLATATAVPACADKADSGFAGLSCGAAIAHFSAGCADSAIGSTLQANCPKSCSTCISQGKSRFSVLAAPQA